MTEVEVKLTISEEDYLKTIEHFKSFHKDTLDQWNIFFDNENHDLRNANRVLRLRSIKEGDEPTKWVITIKKPGSFKNGVAIRPEKEYQIPAEIAQDIITSFVSKNVKETLCLRVRKTTNENIVEYYQTTFVPDFLMTVSILGKQLHNIKNPAVHPIGLLEVLIRYPEAIPTITFS